MSDFREVEKTINVPKNTGVEGFLHTLKEILKRPRLQDIHIDARGKITYKHYVREGESENNFKVDFDFLEPYHIVRNGIVQELTFEWGENAAIVMAMLFEAVHRDQLHPVALVSGAASHFWEWHKFSTRVDLRSQDIVYGLPFLGDRHCEDSTLIMCAAFGRNSTFADTQRSYRIAMDLAAPTTDVKIL